MQGTKTFQYCTCPAGPVTYNFHSSCKDNVMQLSFKSVCNEEHKGVICNLTSSRYSSQSTRPTGQVVWEELLVLSRFMSGLVKFLSPVMCNLAGFFFFFFFYVFKSSIGEPNGSMV